MSKLDQIKALGDALGVSRKSSRGAGQGPSDTVTSSTRGCNSTTEAPRKSIERVNVGPREAKLKLGRPKIKGPRPWELAGMSRRTWHRRRQAERRESEK